ncbi:unnamed protein product [Meloidogyne enterolobii]|uniref:Uncharacterized protein n=1 Tax=Meloidogyne enterolobii TaxID=390850 RepID=A0ACB0ZSF8_MELEN
MQEGTSQKVDEPPNFLHTDDVGSFLDLKAEFIKRRDAALIGKQASHIYSNSTLKNKKNILAITKEEKKAKQQLSERRTQRIRQNEEEIRKEEQQRLRQQQILEQKAIIYERMSHGEKLTYEDGREAEFLVDFHNKKKELEAGCSSSCTQNDDLTDDELRRSDDDDDERQRVKEAPLVVHYDPFEEKGRVFGASHVPLPTLNEEAREKKIAELKSMTEETKIERNKRKLQRNAEKEEERYRVNKIRQRMGLPLLESSEEEEQELSTNGDIQSSSTLPESNVIDNQTTKEEEKPKKFGVREWDRGKVGHMRWIEAQREDRDEEFAPPASYRETKRKR